MKYRHILFLLLAGLFIVSPAIANDDEEFDVKFDDEESNKSWDEHVFNEWDFDRFKSFEHLKESSTIEISSGIAIPDIHDNVYKPDFKMPVIMDLRLGSVQIRESGKKNELVKYNFDYIFIDNANKDIGIYDEKDEQLGIQLWRFGFTDRTGYGWSLGDNAHFALYKGAGFSWTKIDLDNIADTNMAILAMPLDKFNDRFSFSRHFEAGMNLRFMKNLALNTGFERTVVMPRHLFWYWSGSEIIEAIGNGLLDSFISKVRKSSPELAPIVYFVLKNGFAYGMSELKRSNMNWPFSTPEPFIYDNIKVGISFMF